MHLHLWSFSIVVFSVAALISVVVTIAGWRVFPLIERRLDLMPGESTDPVNEAIAEVRGMLSTGLWFAVLILFAGFMFHFLSMFLALRAPAAAA